MTQQAWLVGIDLQRVFGDPASAWCAPRYDAAVAQVERLVGTLLLRRGTVRRQEQGVPVAAGVDEGAGRGA